MVFEIDGDHPVGSKSLGGMKDVTLEAALLVILDVEDSLAAVDAARGSNIRTGCSARSFLLCASLGLQ